MRENVHILTRTALLLALAIGIQSLKMPSLVTGPLVNLVLILATALVGTAAGVIIGSLTPWVALLFGILPAALSSAVPFIMAGNAVYCLFFGLMYRLYPRGWQSWSGLAIGSIVKFVVIGGAAKLLLGLPAPIVEVLFLPQLYNALIGGAAGLYAALCLKRVPGV